MHARAGERTKIRPRMARHIQITYTVCSVTSLRWKGRLLNCDVFLHRNFAAPRSVRSASFPRDHPAKNIGIWEAHEDMVKKKKKSTSNWHVPFSSSFWVQSARIVEGSPFQWQIKAKGKGCALFTFIFPHLPLAARIPIRPCLTKQPSTNPTAPGTQYAFYFILPCHRKK